MSKLNCSSSQTLLFKWYLVKYSENSGGNTIVERRILLDTKSNEWNLPRRQFDYGRYFVDLRVAVASRPLVTSSALGFFMITKSPLVADILGGNKVTRGKGNVITLDGSASSDPDVGPGNHSSMQFTWLCKKQQESFVTLLSSSGSGGCFGTGVGKLSSSAKVAQLDTSQMVVGESYDIKLVVIKDDRGDDFVQEIEIVSGDPPEVTMR